MRYFNTVVSRGSDKISENIQSLITIISVNKFIMYIRRVWHISRDDAFRPKSHGFDSRSSRNVGAYCRDHGQVLSPQLPVALRRETPAQSKCCVGSASEY